MTEPRVTYCRICEAACGMLADVAGDRVIGLRPDPDHVVSRGFACAKGTRFLAIHEDPDRVDYPMQRIDGKLVKTSWDDALARAGARLRAIRDKHGPHSIAVYVGNPSAFAYLAPIASWGFVRALGTRNYFNAGSLDCNNKFVVSRAMLGSPAVHPVPDLDHAAFALLVGTNPSVSQSSFVNAPRMIERLRAIEERSGFVIVVDPRLTETARAVGTHVRIVPDTDALFLLSLVHVVLEEGLADKQSIARYTSGVEALRADAARFAPERVARATGVPASTTRDIARRFAQAHGAFCHVSTGVNQGTFGSLAYAAKIALEAITGNLDRIGGALVPRGAADVAGLARLSGFDREPNVRSRIGNFPTVLGALPSAIFPDEVLTPGDGQVRALVVVGGNPALSMPGGERVRQALDQLELVVSLDLYVNDTAARADFVLPCTDWLEREDLPLAQLGLQPVPYVQWADPVVTPRGERRPEWRILFDLAKATGLPMFGTRTADLATRALIATGGARNLALPVLVPALGPRPLRKMRAHPHGLLIERERERDFLERRISTPKKRVDLHPEAIYSRVRELETTLVPGDSSELRLITRRERLGHNSWMHASKSLILGKHRAFLAPEDAARLGIARGDRILLSSNAGAIEIDAEIAEDVAAGTVAVPHGYGHDPEAGWTAAVGRGGANVNSLAESGVSAVDPLSGMCRFVGIPVRVERLDSRRRAGARAEALADASPAELNPAVPSR